MPVIRILATGILVLLWMQVMLTGCRGPGKTQSSTQGIAGRWTLTFPDGLAVGITFRPDGTGVYEAEAALEEGRRTGNVRLQQVASKAIGATITWKRVDGTPDGISGEIYHIRRWQNDRPSGVVGIFRLEEDRLLGLTAHGKVTGVDLVRAGSP